MTFLIRNISGRNEPCQHRLHGRKCISIRLCEIDSPVMPSTIPTLCSGTSSERRPVGGRSEAGEGDEGWERRKAETACIFDECLCRA